MRLEERGGTHGHRQYGFVAQSGLCNVGGPLRLGAVCLLLLLGWGCVSSSGRLVHADVTAWAAGGFELTPTQSWNRITWTGTNPTQVEQWTRHGVFLDILTFFGGLPDGMTLRATRRRSPGYVPFDSDLGSHGVGSLIEENYRRQEGIEGFRMLATEGVEFLASTGHRFDYEFRDRHDLLWRGRAYVAILNARLYMIQYDAVALHYFDDGMSDVEVMVQNAVAR